MNSLYHNRKHRRLLTRTEGTEHDYELELDNSTLTKTDCFRKFEQYAVLGRDSYPTAALIAGANLHKALDAIHRGEASRAKQILVEAWAEHPTPQEDWRNLDVVLDAAQKYVEEYCGKHELGLPVYKDEQGPYVERHFRVPMFELNIGDNFVYPPSLIVAGDESTHPITFVNKLKVFWTGKQDLMVQNDGLWGADHKTTSMETMGFWADFDLSAQMIGYTWAARQTLKKFVRGVIINAIMWRKPTKTGKGTTFARRSFLYSDEQIAEWFQDTKEKIMQIVDCLITGFFGKTTSVCVGKFSICPYHRVCTLPKSQREMVLMSDVFMDKIWSPLNEDLGDYRKILTSPVTEVTEYGSENLFQP